MLGIVQLALGFVVLYSGEFILVMSLISLNLFVYEATVAPLYWVYAPELMKLEDFSRNQVAYWSFIWGITIICYKVPATSASSVILAFGSLCISLACVVWCFMIETRNKNWDEKYSTMDDV